MEIITGYFTSKDRGLEAAEYLRSHGFNGGISVLGRNSAEDNGRGTKGDNFSGSAVAAGLAAMPNGIGMSSYVAGGGFGFTGGGIFVTTPIVGMVNQGWGNNISKVLEERGVPEGAGNEIKKVIEAGNTVIILECDEHQKWDVYRMLEQTGAQNIHI